MPQIEYLAEGDVVAARDQYPSPNYGRDRSGYGRKIPANTLESLLDQAYDCFCQSVEI